MLYLGGLKSLITNPNLRETPEIHVSQCARSSGEISPRIKLVVVMSKAANLIARAHSLMWKDRRRKPSELVLTTAMSHDDVVDLGNVLLLWRL